ncbi:MAG: T9SS type A sorting domain-containing protein, partial [Ignavibacteriaceae bacterium]
NEITVTSPDGGENWMTEQPYFITWKDNLNGNVEIVLLKGDNIDSIIDSSDPSDGSFTWIIPSNIQPGNEYKIRITSRDNIEIFDESDEYFSINRTTEVEDVFSGIPDTYELIQNYPNPFNSSTKIYYGLPKESSIEIIIYDVLGNLLVVNRNEKQAAGYHKIEFDASALPSGIYLYRLQADSFVETKKMVLLK